MAAFDGGTATAQGGATAPAVAAGSTEPIPYDLAPTWHASPEVSVLVVVALLPAMLVLACALRIGRARAALRSAPGTPDRAGARRIVWFSVWPLVALLAIELGIHGAYLDRLARGKVALATFTTEPRPGGHWIDLYNGCGGTLQLGSETKHEDPIPCDWARSSGRAGIRDVPCIVAGGHIAQIGRHATEHMGRLLAGLLLACIAIALRDPRRVFRRREPPVKAGPT